jgi:predicted transcriptional regulator
MSGPPPGPNYAEAVNLRKRYALTYREIAEHLGITYSRVGQIMKNAVSRGDLPQDFLRKKRSASELLDKMPGYRQTEG